MDTLISYDPEDLISRMNRAMPEGIKFTDCREAERKNKSTSCTTVSASYRVTPASGLAKPDIDGFITQDEILILKREKKTGNMVEKDVKDMLYELKSDGDELLLCVSCANNRTLNPGNLLKSLYEFSGIEYSESAFRIVRSKITLAE